MDARIAATLRPVRSQVVVLAFTIVGAVSLCTGFAFLWSSKPMAAVPLLAGASLLSAAFAMWRQSSRDVDHMGAPPTTVATPNGLVVQTDSRNIDKKAFSRSLARVLNQYANWSPLPHAQGLVGQDGCPIANSAMEAAERVDQANAEARQLFEAIARRIDDARITQTSTTYMPPLADPSSLQRDNVEHDRS
jgi:hypothetical protein